LLRMRQMDNQLSPLVRLLRSQMTGKRSDEHTCEKDSQHQRNLKPTDYQG
jgi:hypothetical protein